MSGSTVIRIAATCICIALSLSCVDPAPRPGTEGLFANADIWTRMLSAEDSRGEGPAGIAPLIEGLGHRAPEIRRIAVRGLGRLEEDSLGTLIIGLLADPSPDVRAEAANALAQAAGVEGAPAASDALRRRLGNEPEPAVRAVIAESLARLPHDDSASVVQTVADLAALARTPGESPSIDSLRLGVARGLYFLARQPAARGVIAEPGRAVLIELATERPAEDSSHTMTGVRTRTVATAALVATGTATVSDLSTVLGDSDPYVRREAVAGLGVAGTGAAAASLISRALDDPSAVVRYEALRVDARINAGRQCTAAIDAIADNDTHVALLAIDRLGTGCGGAAAVELLDSLAATLPAPDAPGPADWHRPAQAVVALARLDPSRAGPHITALEQSTNPFVRMRAARAATLTGSIGTLRRLAADDVANVRTEAVTGLSRTAGHAADSVYIATLRDSDDSQLMQGAAAALTGSPDPDAPSALLDALERFTERARDTERDARVALLNRLAELGDSSHASRLSRFANDYDPRITDMALTTVERWTGERPPPQSQPYVPDPLPTLEQVADVDRARLTIEMEDGTRITARLFAFEAPTNAWRFARLAEAGYFDGLTFHRVAPNFVIQGGSPNANEYSGDGPFSRDELGLRYNWRGTIGLSTRSRDTGDGQLFINLIDNVRLDHEYTVFGIVTSDLEAIHEIAEGDVIRRIRVDM